MDILSRREAAQQANKWIQALPVYLDTETTGTGPNAEIIEIAIVDSNGALLFESLVRPKGAVEPGAMRVHGITQAELSNAPDWLATWPKVESVLSNRKIGIYNSDFDLRMLKQTNKRAWLPWTLSDSAFFCIMKLYARFNGEWDRQRNAYRQLSLEIAGHQSGIQLPNSHRAQDDALLARALLLHMAGWSG